jgi:hypothetical protein
MLGISQLKMMVVLVQVSIFLSPGAVSPGGDLSQKGREAILPKLISVLQLSHYV